MKNIQMVSQKYPFYVKEAKQTLKFPDPLNLVDATESLTNGDIEYKNTIIRGLEDSILKGINFDRIDKNLVRY